MLAQRLADRRIDLPAASSVRFRAMKRPSLVPGCEESLREQILGECEAMIRHAIGNGLPVPGNLAQDLHRELGTVLHAPADDEPNQPTGPEPDITSLMAMHSRLSRIISPANPRTLLLLAKERQTSGYLYFLGPLPLIRQLMLAGVISLIALIWLSLCPEVTGKNNTSDMLVSSGMPLLMNELFFLAAAGLGASFATLFKAHKYIIDGTYDPKYDTLYWSRFILGMIAGLILVEFVPIDTTNHSMPISRPILSILGGFSASVVYQILSRLVDSVGSIVQGDVAVTRMAEQTATDMRREASDAQRRMETVSQLVSLQTQINEEVDPQKLQHAVRKMTQKLIAGEYTGDPRTDLTADKPGAKSESDGPSDQS
jgi:hypothetical protein